MPIVPDFVLEAVARALGEDRHGDVMYDFNPSFSPDDGKLYRTFYLSISIDYTPDYLNRIMFACQFNKGSLTVGDVSDYIADRKTLQEAVSSAITPSFSAIHLYNRRGYFVWSGIATTGAGNADKIRVKTLRNRTEKNLRQAMRDARPLLRENGALAWMPFDVKITSLPDGRADMEKEIIRTATGVGDIHNAPTDEKEEDADQLLIQLAEGKGDEKHIISRFSTKYRITNDAKIRTACRIRAERIREATRITNKALIIVCVSPAMLERSAGRGKSSFARYILHSEEVFGFSPRDVYRPQNNRPFDDYNGERAIYFDEYNPTNCDSFYSVMLQITDPFNPFPVLAPARYSDKAIIASVVLFCTPLTIDEMAGKMAIGGQEPAMILRRIARVYELREVPDGRAEWWSFRYDATGTTRQEERKEGDASEYIGKWSEIAKKWNAPTDE